MSSYKVEQLLHGYQRGHEQLAGSIRLSARDAELITRLSDLSGSLSGAPKFSSYLTVYPLPSGVYFALAKTWPDPDAARAGCVLTHTILVPMPLWSALSEPRRLQTLFSHPTSRSISEFCSSITMFENNWLDGSSSEENIQPAKLNFVQLYFGEGTRPIVWFGQDGPEAVSYTHLVLTVHPSKAQVIKLRADGYIEYPDGCPVSYTHLDVYKRQALSPCCRWRRQR